MVDILWVLVCSGLVFLMQPGFMCLESGLTRSKNSINVAVKNFADFGISVSLFWAFGYALMFGMSHLGWVGTSGFFLTIESAPQLAAFFLFQAMFCGTATTIVSGAVAERMKFSAYLLVSCLTSGLIYPIFGHWAWNLKADGLAGGWLGQLGFTDLAGSSVVHSIGGWISLAALLVIGPRVGRFLPDGTPEKIQGSNLPLSVLGTMLLWLGWLGFNGGSTLVLSDRVAAIMVHTVLAGVAGLVTALLYSWSRHQVPEVELLLNGSLAGLVSITASCDVVTTPAAVAIGIGGGIVTLATRSVLERFRIDDAVDAVPVHLGGGIWGTLALGLFGDLTLIETGLTRWEQVAVQLLGVTVAGIWAFGITYLFLRLCNRHFPLRVSPEEEEMGLNVSEHRAKTEIYDLFKVMDSQARNQDLSMRVPVEPFTEVGQIARRYNEVMDALEDAVNRTNAIVTTASDAILTFCPDTLAITNANPSSETIFGYLRDDLFGKPLLSLLTPEDGRETADSPLGQLLYDGRAELVGRHAEGFDVPLEATATKVRVGDHIFYTGIFRDISERKQAEAALAQANREITLLNDRLKAENLRLGAEIDITRRLQQMLLPKERELQQILELDIAGYMEPATEIGGDYYDVLCRNGQVKIGIGDVTGHGLESGVLMLMVQTAVRTLLESEESDSRRFLDILNRTIYGNVQRMDSDRNLTLSLLDYENGRLRVSGQHEEILIVRANGDVERIDTIDLGFPIGLEASVADFIDETTVELNAGDVVVLYTDGITEAEDEAGNFYGLDRLCAIVRRHLHERAEVIRRAAIADLRRHISQQKVYDDITLLVMKQRCDTALLQNATASLSKEM
ncbi:ammonium transporter [Baaleninema sp.]|uniref:ammonium transporter n=1 Tax=Baaleninema sp. TaxID=3101197 RepID=UPI003D040E16